MLSIVIWQLCVDSRSLSASLATPSSTAAKKVGMPSSTVTSAPRRRHTEPISSPITPEPISPSRRGTASSASAPALDKMRCSSNGTPGKARALDPVATMTCLPTKVSSVAPETLIS